MKRYKIPVCLFVLSACVRLLNYYLDQPVIGPDAAEYVRLARRLASGDYANGLSSYWAPLYPLLVSIPALLITSQLLPAIIISVLTGSLAAVAAYYLIKQSYGTRESLLAAILAIIYPHLLQSTLNLGTENIYLVLMTATIFIFWEGMRRNSAICYFLTGIFLGLSYLTRPEAFGYLLFFISWLVLNQFLSKEKIISLNVAKSGLILFFGFALTAAPYIIYLKDTTGSWTISGKFMRHVAGDEIFSDKKRLYTEASRSPHYIIETVRVFLKLAVYNLHGIHKKLPNLFPPLLLLLVGVGLFRSRWNYTRFKREVYLLSFCAITVLCYTLTIGEIPYFYVLLPILIGWVARGIIEMENWLSESELFFSANRIFTSKFPVFVVLLMILINIYYFPLNSFMRSKTDSWEWSPYEQKKAGLWIKENSTPNPNVMAVDFRPAFYAEGKHIPLDNNFNNFTDLQTEAVSKQVDFIVFDSRNLRNNSQMMNLINDPKDILDFEPVFQDTENENYKILIYRPKRPGNIDAN